MAPAKDPRRERSLKCWEVPEKRELMCSVWPEAADSPWNFRKVLNQAEKIRETLNEGDFYGRLDLRDVTMVTIDGEDAKDLDDAVSLTKEGNLFHLGVHIADVSNYVQYSSALDREALREGPAFYLVDRVIPMLPKKLSNGICSLNAGGKTVWHSAVLWILMRKEEWYPMVLRRR